jgi:hypothetical protein
MHGLTAALLRLVRATTGAAVELFSVVVQQLGILYCKRLFEATYQKLLQPLNCLQSMVDLFGMRRDGTFLQYHLGLGAAYHKQS